MFELALVEDSIGLPAAYLGTASSFKEAIRIEILKKYANKVVPNCGLCISLFDILDMVDPYVGPGDVGGPITSVTFRLAMFRPFVDEILVGKIRSSTEQGIYISMDFFDDIFLPSTYLQPGTAFDLKSQCWVWTYESTALYMKKDEKIRFRILSETFNEVPPVQKEQLMSRRAAFEGQPSDGTVSSQVQPELFMLPSQSLSKPPYLLTASIAEDGLGMLEWWDY